MTQVTAIGASLVNFGNNVLRAFGFLPTAFGGVASLTFAFGALLKGLLRFAGIAGLIYTIADAINWLVKQVTGFDALDALADKIGKLYAQAKTMLGITSGAGAGRGGNAETLKQQQEAGEASRKAWEEQQKAQDAAKAKAKEFAERYAQLAGEIRKVGDGLAYNNDQSLQTLALDTRLVGKSEEQIEAARGLAAIYKQESDTIRQLQEQRRTMSQGTQEQRASVGLIDAEIARVKELTKTQATNFDEYITRLQSARLVERARLQDLDNLKAAIEATAKIQDAIGSARTGIGKQQDIAFEDSQTGKSPIQKQMAQYREDARKAALEAGRAFSQAFEDGGDGLTPERARELAEGLKAIEEGYRGIADSQQDLASKQREFSTGWAEAFAAYVDSANNASNQARSYFDTFTRGFEDAIVNFVQTGKLSFKDLANTIIAEFARVQAKNMISSVFGGGGGGSVTAGPLNILGSIGKIFGFANGGYPPVNRPSIVGERGPELFVPRNAGTIIPNNQLGGNQIVNNSTAVSYQIHAVDAASFKTLLARDPEYLYQVTQAGRRNLPIGSSR